MTTQPTRAFVGSRAYPMKILWVKHGKLLPVDTGGNIRTYNILRHLASRHDLTLISSYSGKQSPGYEAELQQRFAKSIAICTHAPEDSDGIVKQGTHYLARAGSSVPYAVSKFTSPKVRQIVKRELDSSAFDIAVCDFLAVSLNFPKQLNTPTVLFQHNVETSIWRRQAEHEKHWLKKLVFSMEASKMRSYEAESIKRFHHVIAVSDVDRQLMAGFGVDPKNISVVPTGVDLRQFRQQENSSVAGHEVLFVGSMDWEANVDAVIYFCEKIWPRVLSNIPDAKFRIVGRNPHPSVLKLVSNSVEVTGRVPSVIEHLNRAAVVVVPLRIGGGTRLKIYEAMAMGKAVVSTPIGAEGLDVRDRHDIILSERPDDFADQIISLLRDEPARERLGAAAMQTASKYDWSAVADRFEEVLHQVSRILIGTDCSVQITS
jgi:glycosyltransferase involved in cell wall biosynthesis